MEGFVNRQNVVRLADKLYGDCSPEMRATMLRLLLEEEHRYGMSSWTLEEIMTHIREGDRRIDQVKEHLRRLKANGKDTGIADELLNNMANTRELFVRFHDAVQAFQLIQRL